VCYLDAIITVVNSKRIETHPSRDRPVRVENEAEEHLCQVETHQTFFNIHNCTHKSRVEFSYIRACSNIPIPRFL
ncbi:MAG: hypothetical protein ACK53Y_01295, partial [bacterium]